MVSIAPTASPSAKINHAGLSESASTNPTPAPHRRNDHQRKPQQKDPLVSPALKADVRGAGERLWEVGQEQPGNQRVRNDVAEADRPEDMYFSLQQNQQPCTDHEAFRDSVDQDTEPNGERRTPVLFP